jgi:hypothetical protein
VGIEKRANDNRSLVYAEIGNSEKFCMDLTFSLSDERRRARAKVRADSNLPDLV